MVVPIELLRQSEMYQAILKEGRTAAIPTEKAPIILELNMAARLIPPEIPERLHG